MANAKPKLVECQGNILSDPAARLMRLSNAELDTYLGKDPESLFQVSTDGTHYVAPCTLRGVPVARVRESDPYWSRSWDSLETLFAEERRQEEQKREWMKKLALDPRNKTIQMRAKYFQDNVSKHRKIREIFGNADFHPNQLVAKEHMPPGGLCTLELLYRIARSMSHMKELHLRGILRMQPWDFIRWRLNHKLTRKLLLPNQSASGFVRVAIYKAGDHCDNFDNEYEDLVLRSAILRAAELTGHLGSFRPKKKQDLERDQMGAFRERAALRLRRRKINLRRVRAGPPTYLGRNRHTGNELNKFTNDGENRDTNIGEAAPLELCPREERKQIRYQGVNAFRAMALRRKTDQ